MQHIDLIGDIHGYASHLKALLTKMGYEKQNGSYRHPERTALFVGDYIDRGPEIREALHIVRSMVDAGAAIALMGNHEYNAICFHMEDPKGGHLRPHLIKNIKQHAETLLQFQNRQREYDDHIEWFKTLPLWYEDDHIRAVHACWDHGHIQWLEGQLEENRMHEALVLESGQKETDAFLAIDTILKGKEIPMPGGGSFVDKDGHKRTDIRIKWWEDPRQSTYRKLSIVPLETLPDHPVDTADLPDTHHYPEVEKPVFFGHYWLRGEPNLYRGNICCLDYSIAKGGRLAAYRYDGEAVLDNGKWVWV